MNSSTPCSDASSTKTQSASADRSGDYAKCDLALSRSTDYYASKSRTVHAAILEVWNGTPFLEVATKYNQTPDVLASAFAVFGKQAIDIAREKGVVHTSTPAYSAYDSDLLFVLLAMGLYLDDLADLKTVLRDGLSRNGFQQRWL